MSTLTQLTIVGMKTHNGANAVTVRVKEQDGSEREVAFAYCTCTLDVEDSNEELHNMVGKSLAINSDPKFGPETRQLRQIIHTFYEEMMRN